MTLVAALANAGIVRIRSDGNSPAGGATLTDVQSITNTGRFYILATIPVTITGGNALFDNNGGTLSVSTGTAIASIGYGVLNENNGLLQVTACKFQVTGANNSTSYRSVYQSGSLSSILLSSNATTAAQLSVTDGYYQQSGLFEPSAPIAGQPAYIIGSGTVVFGGGVIDLTYGSQVDALYIEQDTAIQGTTTINVEVNGNNPAGQRVSLLSVGSVACDGTLTFTGDNSVTLNVTVAAPLPGGDNTEAVFEGFDGISGTIATLNLAGMTLNTANSTVWYLQP